MLHEPLRIPDAKVSPPFTTEDSRHSFTDTLRTVKIETPEERASYVKYLKNDLIPQMFMKAEQFSFQEYLALAMYQGATALEDGDYGIGAIYVVRAQGKETVIGGRNKILSQKNTHFHAEEDAIDNFEKLRNGDRIDPKNILLQRASPPLNESEDPNKVERFLVTTLEPCIGCTRRITSNKVDQVWIASPDVGVGAMLDGREDQLPALWSDRVKRLQRHIPSDDPQSIYYVAPEYKAEALVMFLSTQQEADEEVRKLSIEPTLFHDAVRRSLRTT